MKDQTTTEEQAVEEEAAGVDDTRNMAGPCDTWPPVAGCCGGGRAWVRLGGRWICKPMPGCP